MIEFFKEYYENIVAFDIIYLIITLLSLIKCSRKGFILSILEAAKWLLALLFSGLSRNTAIGPKVVFQIGKLSAFFNTENVPLLSDPKLPSGIFFCGFSLLILFIAA